MERFHSTLLEIARAQHNITDISDLILLSTYRYNNTIHSVTGEKSIDILQYIATDNLKSIRANIVSAQGNVIRRNTDNRKFNTGDIVFVRRNKRLGNKIDKVYLEKIVERDLGTKVIVDGREVHKDNLR